MKVTYQPHSQTFRFTGGAAVENWRVFDSESLRWAEFDAATGDLYQAGTDRSCKPSDAQMSEWREIANRYAQVWSGRLGDLNAALYIRFGNMPKGGRSKNYVTGQMENGLSVYAATYDLETGAIILDGSIANPGTLFFMVGDRPVYLVTGEEIGEGSDGEPLLENAKKLATLRYDSEKAGFVR